MYINRNTFSFKDTNRVSAIPQLTNQQRWHTLMALPGQNGLARHDLHGLRPTPVGSPNRPPMVHNHSRRLPKPLPMERGHTLRTRMASAAAAAAARARLQRLS